ncbi:hypothetical protein [Agromyces sp. NPDC057865]|uniref:hypothetical protein n=1 Tax=Agromyces sp. NPDC057865 TaxID=3346267 RepID=UPI003670D15C
MSATVLTAPVPAPVQPLSTDLDPNDVEFSAPVPAVGAVARTVGAPVVRDRTDAPPAAPRGLSIITAAPGLWRVALIGGPVLGHIELRERDGEERFVARRLLRGGLRSIELGEFWSPTDAAECFR